MPMKHTITKIALAAVFAATAALAQTPYDEGQKALRDQNWMEAADQFRQVILDDGEQVDAAHYWRAYAYYKAGRRNEAERELRHLERRYPKSSWVKEGQALRIEHQKTDESVEQLASGGLELDEELRLFALAQLMERDPERALPLVQDLARNAESESVRRDALFVMGLSESPGARQALVEIARNPADPESQIDAIHMLGTLEATDELQALYPTLQDKNARIAVIESFSIAGDTSMLKETLASETDPELRKAAIFGIAMEDNEEAVSYIESLYASSSSVEEKTIILEALTIMDDAGGLASKILSTEPDPELQRQAILVLGIMGDTRQLGELYGSMESPESRRAILEAMSISEDTEGLIRVLETERDPELRANAIALLGVSGGKEAKQALARLYTGGSREEKSAVIESMMIMEDTEGLLALMKQENDPELKREMLQMLTIMDSEESDKYLFELLEKNG